MAPKVIFRPACTTVGPVIDQSSLPTSASANINELLFLSHAAGCVMRAAAWWASSYSW